MKTFPMFLKMAGRRVVVIGGGEQAAQKARLVLKTEAALTFVARTLDSELEEIVASGRAIWERDAAAATFDNAALVFVATGCPGADGAWHARAKAAGAVVNVVDNPALCDAITPSIVDRDPVVVAIGTEGTAPVLGRQLKTRIEEILHPRLGDYAALAGRLRPRVAQHVDRSQRRPFWRWFFTAAPWHAFSNGQEDNALEMIETAITTGETADSGLLTVVSGAIDAAMIPMGAVQRLQEADLILRDHRVPKAILEYARRDAERETITAERVDRHILPGMKTVWLRSAATAPEIGILPDPEMQVEAIACGAAHAPVIPALTPPVIEPVPVSASTARSVVRPVAENRQTEARQRLTQGRVSSG
ncbi:MAG: NAD(P)-dependent oxidoreductase [Pseudomonadota bacterium]